MSNNRNTAWGGTGGDGTATVVGSGPQGLPVQDVLYYAAAGDGVTDDTVSIQTAINAAKAAGGGIVHFPVGTYIVNGTLSLDNTENVRLEGAVSGRNLWTAPSGAVLKRTSGTGTMITWQATDARTDPLRGTGIKNLSLNCGQLASSGLIIGDHGGGVFENMVITSPTTVCLDIKAIGVVTTGCQFNSFKNIQLYCGGGVNTVIGLRLSGNTGATNVSLNNFSGIDVFHWNGVGVDLGDCDSNTFTYLHTVSAGSGVGILCRGSNTLNANYCRANQFFGVHPASGVTLQGTGLTQPTIQNFFLVQTETGAVTLTVETGATCVWMEDTGQIGKASTNKIGFYGATPVVRPSTTGTSTGFTAGGGTTVTDASTFTGAVGSTAYRLSDIVKHLKNLGLIAT